PGAVNSGPPATWLYQCTVAPCCGKQLGTSSPSVELGAMGPDPVKGSGFARVSPGATAISRIRISVLCKVGSSQFGKYQKGSVATHRWVGPAGAATVKLEAPTPQNCMTLAGSRGSQPLRTSVRTKLAGWSISTWRTVLVSIFGNSTTASTLGVSRSVWPQAFGASVLGAASKASADGMTKTWGSSGPRGGS